MLQKRPGRHLLSSSALLAISPWLTTVLLLSVVGLPIVMVLLLAFDTTGSGGAAYGLDNWRSLWRTPGIGDALWNTLTIVVTRVLIGLAVATFFAWLIARTNMPGRSLLEFGFWVSFFMPSLAVMQGWLFLAGGDSGLLNILLDKLPFIDGPVFDLYTYFGILWVHWMGVNVSLTVVLLVPIFRQMDSSLEEAAYMSGASKLQMVKRIYLPLMRPSIIFLAVLGFIKAMQSFEVERILGGPKQIDVYATILVRMVSGEPRLMGEGSALSSLVLVVLLILVVLQRLLTRGQYTTVSSKMRVSMTDLGKWRIPAFLMLSLFVCMLTVVPLLSVLTGTFMTRWGYFATAKSWTATNWSTALNDPAVVSAIFTTLKFGLIAGVCGAFLMYIVSYTIVRIAFRGNAILDFASWLPWAVPGVLLSLGVSAAILNVPSLRWLNGSSIIVVIALIIYSFPAGTQLLKSAFFQLHSDLEESGRVSGARWSQVQRKVVVPLLLPTIVGAGLITFVAALSEVSGIVLLAPTDTRTLALVSLDYMTQSKLEVAGVINTILLLMAVGVALIARSFGVKLGAADR